MTLARGAYIGGLVVLMLAHGCLFDPDSPCGPNQYFADEDCLCVEGMILNEAQTGCVACGENEVAAGTVCVCEEGYRKAEPDALCEPLPEGLGQECDPDSSPCVDPEYSYCHVPEQGTPYCTTQGCETNEECGGGFGCEVRTSPTFCSRYPSGLGMACSSTEDCAGYEANYCETFRTKICLVDECAGPDVRCYGGSVCCDYAQLGVPLSVCVGFESLEEGNCPLGGALVPE